MLLRVRSVIWVVGVSIVLTCISFLLLVELEQGILIQYNSCSNYDLETNYSQDRRLEKLDWFPKLKPIEHPNRTDQIGCKLTIYSLISKRSSMYIS